MVALVSVILWVGWVEINGTKLITGTHAAPADDGVARAGLGLSGGGEPRAIPSQASPHVP